MLVMCSHCSIVVACSVVVSDKKIEGPAHTVEGDHHFRKAQKPHPHIDELVQERCNYIANALKLHLSCTNPSI